jgi:hypothetical protein
MSYMKSGRAQRWLRWAARIFHWEDLSENAGCTHFLNWEHFRDEFRKDFMPMHAYTLAINKLESPSYHQMSRTLDDYLDKFQDLIMDSGYTDPRTIVVKFRRGLNPEIQNAVATMGVGRPSDTCPQNWYAMATTVDQNRAANEAFVSFSLSTMMSVLPRPASVGIAVAHRLSTGRARGPTWTDPKGPGFRPNIWRTGPQLEGQGSG